MGDPHTDLDRARVDYARTRAAEHAERELYMVQLAMHTSDGAFASRLEYYALEAHLDALAMMEEHDLDN